MTKDTFPDDKKPEFNGAANDDHKAIQELTRRIMTFFSALKDETYLPDGKSIYWKATPAAKTITLTIGTQDENGDQTDTQAEWMFPRPITIMEDASIIGTPRANNPMICQRTLELPQNREDIPASQMAIFQALFIIPQDIARPVERNLQNPDEVRARLQSDRDDILSKLGIFRAPE